MKILFLTEVVQLLIKLVELWIVVYNLPMPMLG
ncbi:hypothetical protein SAMN05216421_1127 [Halopseudomonas xinjiangensis]|uniref:Uncharacterized protein n=1 Tax=Halopseudomonas xinjiangensis TaxID=487184 RepID=A0A1H1QH94_9GAMM|nr:hypothetical protein SAMN05216421_1127 [Halopseudomonas xinjiangensis]